VQQLGPFPIVNRGEVLDALAGTHLILLTPLLRGSPE